MRYRRDVPRGDQAAVDAETAHIIAHLSSVADADDDPDTRAEDVTITIGDHYDGDPGLVTIVGYLDAGPDAPYLRADYDPDLDGAGITFAPFGVYDADAFAAFQEGR